MKAFLRELRNRKVIQVGAVYLVASWLIMQVADVMFPALDLPEWSVTLVAALLILGFPVALILSWAYELGPGGLRRDERETADAAAAQPDAAEEPETAAGTGTKSVAVLPFVDLSREKDQEYFSDGLTEELLNALSQAGDLRVCSRTSSFAFKNTGADIPSVAERLGVGFVVEGSVRKAGDRLRITAQLIEAASDSHLWSHTYDRDLDDIFAIQDDIAKEIASALHVRLVPQALPDPSTDNVQAYEFFLRGRSFFNRLGHHNFRRAIGMFEEAIRIDPDFARAWAGLALAHAYCVLLHLHGAGSEDMRAADAASEKAIALRPDLADGYTARIMVMAVADRGDEAEAAFRKAVELDPSNFEACYQFGRLRFKQGHLEQAVAMFERAHELDPDDFQTPLLSMSIYDTLGQKQKSLEAARSGVRAAEAHLEQHPDNPRAYMLAAGGLLRLGERDKAVQYADSAMRLDPDSEDTQYNGACFYAAAGEIDKALDCLERGLHDPEWMDNDADLDPLRDQPRFEALMERARAPV